MGMGQKIDPRKLRVSIIKDWNSNWFRGNADEQSKNNGKEKLNTSKLSINSKKTSFKEIYKVPSTKKNGLHKSVEKTRINRNRRINTSVGRGRDR